MIEYTEFLAAAINTKKYLTKEKKLALFRSFDVEGDGMIDFRNLKNAFTKLGYELSDAELSEMLNAHDAD